MSICIYTFTACLITCEKLLNCNLSADQTRRFNVMTQTCKMFFFFFFKMAQVSNYFTVCHLNVQSLLANTDHSKHILSQYSKLDEIHLSLVSDHNFDVIALTETWLNANHTDNAIAIDDYFCFRKDRITGRGGGIAVYIRDNIPAIQRLDLEQGILSCEIMWLELKYGTFKILFGTCYRPPGQNAEQVTCFLTDIQNCLNTIYSDKPECIILTGDDRATLFYDEHPTSELGNKLRDLVIQNNLFQLITEPTHFVNNSAHILDLMITDSPGYVIESGVLQSVHDLHHLPVFSKYSITQSRQYPVKREVWHYRNADVNGLNTAIQAFNWTELINSDNVDSAVDRFTKTYMHIAKDFIPTRVVKKRAKDKPWITSGLRKLIRLRNRWSGIYNRTGKDDHYTIRNIFRSRVKNELKRLKKEFFDQQLDKLNDPSMGCKQFWSIAKQLYGNKIKQPIPTLIHNNQQYSSNEEKATLLNNYFAEQSTLPDPPSDFSLPDFNYITNSRLDEIIITPYQVSQIIEKLPVNKASGPDLISNQLLKSTCHTICEPLATLFNKSLMECIYPSAWKSANLTSVFKKNENFLRENYRPISLLSC